MTSVENENEKTIAKKTIAKKVNLFGAAKLAVYGQSRTVINRVTPAPKLTRSRKVVNTYNKNN